MEITIKGEPKEIAALVLAIQERQDFGHEKETEQDQIGIYMNSMGLGTPRKYAEELRSIFQCRD